MKNNSYFSKCLCRCSSSSEYYDNSCGNYLRGPRESREDSGNFYNFHGGFGTTGLH